MAKKNPAVLNGSIQADAYHISLYNGLMDALINTMDLLSNIPSNASVAEPLLGTSNFIGEYAEILVCKSLGLTQADPSSKGFDAIDANGMKYQIKSRLIRSWKKNRNSQSETGLVKTNASGNFDFDRLIICYFENDLDNVKAYEIPDKNIKLTGKQKKNGYVFNESIIQKQSSLINDISAKIKF